MEWICPWLLMASVVSLDPGSQNVGSGCIAHINVWIVENFPVISTILLFLRAVPITPERNELPSL